MLTQLTRGGQECVVMAGHDRSELFVTTKVDSGSCFFQKYVNGIYVYKHLHRYSQKTDTVCIQINTNVELFGCFSMLHEYCHRGKLYYVYIDVEYSR